MNACYVKHPSLLVGTCEVFERKGVTTLDLLTVVTKLSAGKSTLMRRSTVLSLPPQLVFPAIREDKSLGKEKRYLWHKNKFNT